MGQSHQTPQQTVDPQVDNNQKSSNGQQNGQGQGRGNAFMQTQMQVQNMKTEANQKVSNWYTESLHNVDSDVTNTRNAADRYIEFDESGTAEFKTMLGVVGAVASLATFGTAGAVIGLACGLLGAVADVSGGKSGKVGALAGKMKMKRDEADKDAKSKRDGVQKKINAATTVEALQGLQAEMARLPAVKVVDENIIYREMLLTRAQNGGNNISGSQWNVDNTSVWGDAPWYRTWDWGSPGWNNGQDIAEELNSLPKDTRKTVRIN